MDETLTEGFEAERSRLVGLATKVLGDPVEAEDVVQQAWLRLHGTRATIDNLPGWLTTVTARLCLDRLRSRTPELRAEVEPPGVAPDPADDVALADAVGVALHVVLDRLTPRERVAFVLHDSFGFEFDVVAQVLDTTSTAARKLASRARAKVAQPVPEDAAAEARVVDAFMDAARGGDLTRLLELLAPDVVVVGDEAAVAMGTPSRMEGRQAVAEFFNGGAQSALPVHIGERPGAAWYDRGTARVAFDFTVTAGQVTRIDFRAAGDVLSQVRRRARTQRRTRPDG